MTLQAQIRGEAGQWVRAVKTIENQVADAATGATREAAAELLKDGRTAIRERLGERFANAFRVEVYPRTGRSITPAMLAHHRIPYAWVFQSGADIAGHPWMWVPLGNTAARVGGRRLTPKAYQETIGPLHLIVSKGKRYLAAYVRASGRFSSRRQIPTSRLRAGAALARLGVRQRRGAYGSAGVVSVPIFVGVRRIHLRQAFDLQPVYRRTADNLAVKYHARMAA